MHVGVVSCNETERRSEMQHAQGSMGGTRQWHDNMMWDNCHRHHCVLEQLLGTERDGTTEHSWNVQTLVWYGLDEMEWNEKWNGMEWNGNASCHVGALGDEVRPTPHRDLAVILSSVYRVGRGQMRSGTKSEMKWIGMEYGMAWNGMEWNEMEWNGVTSSEL